MPKTSFREYKGPGGKHVAYFKYRGKLHSRVVQTKKEGKEWRKEKETELRENNSHVRLWMFSDLAKSYLNYCNTRLQPNTVSEKIRHLEYFKEFLGQDVPVEKITTEIGMEFIQIIQEGKGNKTANRYLRTLKATWNCRLLKHKFEINPWKALDPYPEDPFKKYIPQSVDIEKIKEFASEWERDFINVFLKTGARRGEILNLKWEDIDLTENTLVLWTRKNKNGEKRSRVLPISEGLKEILLRKWNNKNSEYVFAHPKNGKRYDKDQTAIKNMLKKLCEAANVKIFGFHALRHHVTHKLLKSGSANLVEIQNFLGHQKLSTTEIYLKTGNHQIKHLAPILDD